MKFDHNTPTANCTVQGLSFACPQPYAEGQTLSEKEAGALNALLIENVRNNFANDVDKLVAAKGVAKSTELAAADKELLANEFLAYVAKYEFSPRRGSQRFFDPVTRQARVIGKAKVRETMLKKGWQAADLTTEVINEQLEKNWAAKSEEWIAMARAILAAQAQAKDDQLVVPSPANANAQAA